jgi:hypothetical protein
LYSSIAHFESGTLVAKHHQANHCIYFDQFIEPSTGTDKICSPMPAVWLEI